VPWKQPLWDGSSLEGRTILLQREQGLGDILQFIRYAPLVKARGGRVLFVGPKRMLPILRGCAGIDEFCAEGDPLRPFDVYAPLMSLPGILGTELDSIPAEVPYLAADEALVAKWRQALDGEESALRIGINWQGNTDYSGDRYRSIPLAEFAPLAAVDGVRLFSLQCGAGVEQLAQAPFAARDLGSTLDEADRAFCETAAIVANLDLVITSDTALAHLAGALAARVWTAIPFAPDSRWMLERADSPWYPTMRLFRQQTRGDWAGVFRRMAEELAGGAAKRRKSG
jgi:hypothetical protein